MNIIKKIVAFAKKEVVLSISFVIAVISQVVVRSAGEDVIGFIDFRVIALLFCLMGVMAGLRELGVFKGLAAALLKKVHSTRGIAAVLIMLSFVMAMFITNDVALITFVPFTLMIIEMIDDRKYLIYIITMQTIAANLGSMLLPIGNPQNLYLYSLTDKSFGEFVLMMLPYTALSFVLLVISIFFIKADRIDESKLAFIDGKTVGDNKIEDESIKDDAAEDMIAANNTNGDVITADGVVANKTNGDVITADGVVANKTTGNSNSVMMSRIRLVAYLVMFGVSILSVARVLDYRIMLAICIIGFLAVDYKNFARIDYCLLGTFVCFFIFVGNVGAVGSLKEILANLIEDREVIVSFAASQVISNVPAATLISGFTDNIDGIIVGSNIGGLGTLIASLASLISYKFYARAGGNKGKYMLWFSAINVIFAVLLMGLYFVLSRR